MIGLTKLASGPGNVALSEREPGAVGPGQIGIAVRAAGICGTDLHIWDDDYPSVPPVTMGHEVCGIVTELGEGVSEALLGRRVVVETFYSTCGRCAYCRSGRVNLCPERRSIGSHADGGMAPWLVVPAHNAHMVPERLSDAAASLSEPLACVCNSMLDPPAVQAGDRVLVIGPGAIGMLAAQVARAGGATVTVRGTARDGARLELAGELGFETEVDAVGVEPSVVVECSGSAAGARHGLERLARGGTFVLMGLSGGDVSLPLDLVCYRELSVRAGFASTPQSWRTAMQLLADDALELEALVTEIVPLVEWRRGFDASKAGTGVKYVLDPTASA